jgi:hypothetical protein
MFYSEMIEIVQTDVSPGRPIRVVFHDAFNDGSVDQFGRHELV